MTFSIYAWVLVTVIGALDCVIIGVKIQESMLKNQNNRSNQKKKGKKNNG